jgi:CheY-like chemotaxis protein/CRP-like cAMP-binding protein
MVQHYLVVDEGLGRERLILLADKLTIGRDAANDIQLSDSSVSKQHAAIRLLRGHPVIEDLGSRNGIVINDERVKKALLHSGDTLKLGNSTLRFVQKTASPTRDELNREVTAEAAGGDISLHGGALPSRRVLEAVSRAPLFAGFTKEQLARICQGATLFVFAAGQTIVRQGDRGRALYLILDGMVRVSTRDNGGKEVFVFFLKEDQIFGEMSFLTGLPCTATVRAENETLICELRGEVMRQIANSSPGLKGAMEEYYRDVLKMWEGRKKAAGIKERRRAPRFNMALRVDFSMSPTAGLPAEVLGKTFQAQSTDISVSGARVKVQDPSLLRLPMGQALRMAIFLPHPWGTIHCQGLLRNVSQEKGESDVACLGAEFAEMATADKGTLERFLIEGETAAAAKILVADDDAPVRELLGNFLKGKGYQVVLAANGEEVLKLAASEKPHVILLDVWLPQLDGIKVCQRLKANEKTRAIPIIVATGVEDTLLQALEAGADDFVSQPYRVEEIATLISMKLRDRG